MPNTLFVTEDGSHTLFSHQFAQHYHSTHGAVQESMHIFIRSGLQHYIELYGIENEATNKRPIRIFEVGFGTGLNALLSSLYAENYTLHYESVELYPISEDIYRALHFPLPFAQTEERLQALHRAVWDKPISLTPRFTLHKVKQDILHYTPDNIDVVFFDAFSPEAQPDLWSDYVFQHLYKAMTAGGVLVTYCAKGEVRRRLQAVGFAVERIAGPPGKRHILRATKV